MAGNEFVLPNELGWKANDEISELMDAWANTVVEGLAGRDENQKFGTWQVAKAELMDDMYTAIKKYQKESK